LGDVLFDVVGSFEIISFSLVFRELNQEADELLKESQHIPKGHISWEEIKDGISNFYMTILGVGLVYKVFLFLFASSCFCIFL